MIPEKSAVRQGWHPFGAILSVGCREPPISSRAVPIRTRMRQLAGRCFSGGKGFPERPDGGLHQSCKSGHIRRKPKTHDGRWQGNVDNQRGYKVLLWRSLRCDRLQCRGQPCLSLSEPEIDPAYRRPGCPSGIGADRSKRAGTRPQRHFPTARGNGQTGEALGIVSTKGSRWLISCDNAQLRAEANPR